MTDFNVINSRDIASNLIILWPKGVFTENTDKLPSDFSLMKITFETLLAAAAGFFLRHISQSNDGVT